MRGVLLEVPAGLLEERRRLGIDGRDEMWDGVVHVVPPAGDETYDKIDWYAARGVREMLIVHPEGRRVELLRAVGGRLLPVSAGPDGAVHCEVLDVRLATVDGRLRITWSAGTADV